MNKDFNMSKVERKYNYVYKITNVVNDRFYVGIHSTDNLDDYYMGSGILLNKAITIFGESNFKKEIIEFCENRDQAIELEMLIVDSDFIERLDTYNMVVGGGGRDCYINYKRKGTVLGENLKTGDIQVVFSDEIDNKTFKHYHTGLKRNDITKKRISNKAKDKVLCLSECNEIIKISSNDFKKSEYRGIQYGKKRYYHPETLHKITIPENDEPPNGYIHGTPSFSEDHKNGISMSSKGKQWITNGKETKRINKNDEIPYGWYKGRHYQRNHIGSVFINNGIKESKITKDDPIPNGWIKGRIKVECPHCLKKMDSANANRYHFDKCKSFISSEGY